MNYKTIKHVPLAAVNGRKLLGVFMRIWRDIVLLQDGKQVRLSVEHSARHSNKSYQAIIAVLLQRAFGYLQCVADLLAREVAFAIELWFVVHSHFANIRADCSQLFEHCSAIGFKNQFHSYLRVICFLTNLSTSSRL